MQIIDTEKAMVTIAESSHVVRTQKLLCDPGYDVKFNILANLMFVYGVVYCTR